MMFVKHRNKKYYYVEYTDSLTMRKVRQKVEQNLE